MADVAASLLIRIDAEDNASAVLANVVELIESITENCGKGEIYIDNYNIALGLNHMQLWVCVVVYRDCKVIGKREKSRRVHTLCGFFVLND
ncbi:MAG: hypothetical protein SOS24_01035 [Clostridia bacterium]|nr:hypothetical protein [Clostridia bacterium]